MGKPIAGQNQFPYTIGGFLVDGAKINGVTYAKKLYIYKQRSYNYYDLMDIEGNIFQFIEIGSRDTDGKKLNYFEVDENLVKTIPDNTFFLKIQDPSRDIYSFVQIYQWRKCITVDGDYVYRENRVDPRLSGVLINPLISTIEVGSTVALTASFYPENYHNTNGTWYINQYSNYPDGKINVSISDTYEKSTVVRGEKIGKSLLTFVPESNDALVTHSLVNVIEPIAEPDFRRFAIVPEGGVNCLLDGDELKFKLVTFPYKSKLTKPVSFEVKVLSSVGEYNKINVDLVNVSSDFTEYTFKFNFLYPNDEKDANIGNLTSIFNIVFKTTENKVTYSSKSYDITLMRELLYYTYAMNYDIAFKSKEEMTVPSNKTYLHPFYDYSNFRTSRNKKISILNPEIGTFNYDTSELNVNDVEGTLNIQTYTLKYTVDSSNSYTIDFDNFVPIKTVSMDVSNDIYVKVDFEPFDKLIATPGETFQIKIYGIMPSGERHELDFSIDNTTHVLKLSDGSIKVRDDAPLNENFTIYPVFDKPVYTWNIHKHTPLMKLTIQNGDFSSPMISYNSYLRYLNSLLVVSLDMKSSNALEFTSISNLFTNGIVLAPYGKDSFYIDDFIFELTSYDSTLIEFTIDTDWVLGVEPYQQSKRVNLPFRPLKTGTGEIILTAKDNPDIVFNMTVIVI